MPKDGVRLPKSESTRIKLLDCAVAEILVHGPDNIGFTSIARRADMSTGALYARYENVDELILDVWLHRGLPTFRRLIADMNESLDTHTGKHARRRIADMLRDPDPELSLLTKILVIARRNEAVGEFVIPSTVELVEKALATTPAFDFYLGQILGMTLGVQGSGFVGVDWYGPVSIVASSVRDATDVVIVDANLPAIPEAGNIGVGLDDLDRRLFGAVARVISRVGIDRSTISRIARHADINPATIYMRYADREALFCECFSHVMETTYGENERLVAYYNNLKTRNESDARQEALIMFRGNQSTEHAEIRRLRLEMMLGAAHHEKLRDITHNVLTEILLVDQKNLGFDQGAVINKATFPILIFNRLAFFGYALLADFDYLQPDNELLESFFTQMRNRLLAAASSEPHLS